MGLGPCLPGLAEILERGDAKQHAYDGERPEMCGIAQVEQPLAERALRAPLAVIQKDEGDGHELRPVRVEAQGHLPLYGTCRARVEDRCVEAG